MPRVVSVEPSSVMAAGLSGCVAGTPERPRGEMPGPAIDIYLADTIGELGLFYRVAPIVFRMAMSRLFSMTSSTSDATMLSAATMTMRPMVIEIAIFSSHSAEKSELFISDQSCS